MYAITSRGPCMITKIFLHTCARYSGVGSIARKYGVYRQQDGTTERALFVIDSEGVIRWSYVSPIGINPGAEGILKALESLSEPSKKED